MSSALSVEESHIVERAGWRAEVHLDRVLITVLDPSEDQLSGAVEQLVAEPRRRYWCAEPVGEDDEGRSLWLLLPSPEVDYLRVL